MKERNHFIDIRHRKLQREEVLPKTGMLFKKSLFKTSVAILEKNQ